MFIREAATFMWRDILLDRESWAKVSNEEKNAMMLWLSQSFDIDTVLEDPEAEKLWADLDYQRYRGRKTSAKNHFMRTGGYVDVTRAGASIPMGKDEENWQKVDFFLSNTHMTCSVKNKGNRANQTIKNHGGTATYIVALLSRK